MPRLLPFISMCLTLLTAACKADKAEPDPVPAPLLEGRWYHSQLIYSDYTPSGQLIERKVYDSRKTTYLIFEPDVLYFFNALDNTWTIPPTNYKRVGNELYGHPDGFYYGVITKLTKDTLQIQRAKWYTYYPSGNYIDEEKVYTR
jgi:hypothetical protein